jgi:glucose/arabinose dehydrogenase
MESMPCRCVIALFLIGVLASEGAGQISSDLYVSGLSQPVGFVQDPSDPDVQYVVEQAGRIRAIDDGELRATDFLDLRGVVGCCGERGLLGLAFPPDHAETGRFYVNFTNASGDTVIARFRRSLQNTSVADPSSRFDLRWPSGQRFITQPFSNHNGGHLAFGPDGYLYVGLGDGGDGNDPEHFAQDPDSLLGKMLRLDVSVPDSDPNGYRVPADNPFVGDVQLGALGEIWSFGLRNPWRYSFDDRALGGTGALVIADVGQGAWEEINYEPAGEGGRNYGWRNREGAHDNVTSLPQAYLPLTDPIREYDHTVGRSITGGYIYRGGALPSRYLGEYFYGDFIRRRLWSLDLSVDLLTGDASAGAEDEHTASLGGEDLLGNISSMGVDAGGELYVLNYSAGTVRKIVPTAPPGDLYVDFGLPHGIWVQVEGLGWRPVHPVSPESMVTGDPDGNGRDDLIVDFGAPHGIWIWFNHSKWVQLNPTTPVEIVTADLDGSGRDEVIVSFGDPHGVWIWQDNTSWVQLHDHTPEQMVAGDLDGNGQDDVVVDFGDPHGIHTWFNGEGWVQLHGSSPRDMVTGDVDGNGRDDVVVDFGEPFGIYTWLNDTSWVQLHGFTSRQMTVGDLDGNGQDDVVIDFGQPWGVHTRFNNASWVQLHGFSPEQMVTADLDGDGRDDVAVDFGFPYGIYAWTNDTSWVQLHGTSGAVMEAGELDGP